MRGQVAFIAIVGALVIIAAVGAILIFSYEPSAPEPVESSFSIEQCAAAALDDSLSLVSLYGGWYQPSPHHVTKDHTFEMGPRAFALWAEEVEIPTQSALESQVELALLDRLDSCTADLEGPRTATVDVQMSPSRTRAAIEVDAWMPNARSDQRIAPFVVESALPALRARDIAAQFTRELWDEDVLTDLNFNLISLNPQVPLEGMEFSCEPKRWSVDEVREQFFSGVQDSIPYVSFDGVERVADDRIAPKLTFDLDLPSEVSLSSYYFTDFGGELDVEQSSGDQMTSFVTRSSDGTLCQNTHTFWYSMNYPIVFTLGVPDRGDEFLFRFAVPVATSRNTEPEVERSGSSFCSDVTPREFTLSTEDAVTGDPIDDVIATFSCGSQSCPLASSTGGIADHLPSRCLSGTIALDRVGYERLEIDYRYDEQLSGTTVELEPLARYTLSLTCDAAPCAFPGRLFARVDGKSTLLREGTTFVPRGDITILVIEQLESGIPMITYELVPDADIGTGVTITVDTDNYAAPGGLGITQIFPSGIASGEAKGAP